MLIARIYETFPLACPACGATMRIIAFITEAAPVHHILDHIGEPHEPPPIHPPRGPPTGSMQTSGSSWTKTSIKTATRLSSISR
jgi:hypothetical protein